MNIIQLIFAQTIMVVSLLVACGVLIHDTHVDKAVSSVWYKSPTGDIHTDASQARPSSNLHPHAEHLSIVKDRADNAKALPKNRTKKHLSEQKRPARGYHGDNFCMPLAGEWA